MSDSEIRFSDRLRERFADQILRVIDSVDVPTVEIKSECWVDVARALRDEAEFRFEQAVDLCGVDYLGHGCGLHDAGRCAIGAVEPRQSLHRRHAGQDSVDIHRA